MCLLQINKKNCLHCGHGFANYCEKCYQDLISENAKLQAELDCYKTTIKEIYKNIEGGK